ncbi:DUF317 domain-containing protein [Streptomyces sp. NBC_01244]|uniref:DUF317 domain-containing protein n=1 Tax=Streptomyces sp. NBC_01244 TaxID=2903797 RepID=UPI002E10F0BF|nr:DUF317 domain-containing protein [Streptomyces sp. NBC_01244]
MPQTDPAAPRVRLALHPGHGSAVVATLTDSGPGRDLSHELLALHHFRRVDDRTAVLARIDHDEPHYANQAALVLREKGASVEIDAALQTEIDTKWTYGNHPMPHLDRDEIREVSAEAQRIHDDIRSGNLIIHLHAHDGWTTVAVGTYQGGKSVHLHGEDYLRQETADYESEAEAVADFQRQYTVAVRPGPAPLTATERAAAKALTTLTPTAEQPSEKAAPAPEAVAPAAATPQEHEALLESFLAANGEWEKYRTWMDVTIANHESLTLRAEFDHEARHSSDVAWTIAAYESPVGERLWHATASPTTPTLLVRALLESLTVNDPWNQTPTQDLAEAGWSQTTSTQQVYWQAPDGSARFEHDPYAAKYPHNGLPAWTASGGTDLNHPTWAIHLSSATPPDILGALAFELASASTRPAATPPPARPQALLPTPAVPTAPVRTAHRRR